MGPKVIIIGGKLSLYFIKALGIKIGVSDKEIEDAFLLDICWKILIEAKQKDIEIVLPTDFVIVEKPRVEH